MIAFLMKFTFFLSAMQRQTISEAWMYILWYNHFKWVVIKYILVITDRFLKKYSFALLFDMTGAATEAATGGVLQNKMFLKFS